MHNLRFSGFFFLLYTNIKYISKINNKSTINPLKCFTQYQRQWQKQLLLRESLLVDPPLPFAIIIKKISLHMPFLPIKLAKKKKKKTYLNGQNSSNGSKYRLGNSLLVNHDQFHRSRVHLECLIERQNSLIKV